MQIAFFVTGQGRSGTKWLARLLDRSPGVKVYHEAIGGWDARVYEKIYNRRENPLEYLKKREPMMERLWKRYPNRSFAEVNSYLRYCVPELRKIFRVPTVAIIRDGRFVIRSMLSRGIYRRRPRIRPIAERDASPMLISKWERMSRFERVCWYWADAYRILQAQDVPIFQIEELTRDYNILLSLCQNHLLIEPNRRAWQRFSKRRINVTKELPQTPPVWTLREAEAFEELAGDIQRFFQYSAPIVRGESL